MELAGGSAVAAGAVALKPLLAVAARVAASALVARLVGAGEQLLLAHATIPALGADALVAALRCLVHAGATVLAGIHNTVARVNFRLAIVAAVSRCTLARIQALASVEAGAAIHAGTMVRAVVQILIAEQTAPALVAYAVPGLVACAMHAARIRSALIAQRSSPALLTAAK